MSNNLTQSYIEFLESQSEEDASKIAAQMTSLLTAMKDEKDLTDSMINMLNKQSWIKRIIYFKSNKVTKASIIAHRDELIEIIMNTFFFLYQNQLKEQVARRQAVNVLSGQLNEFKAKFVYIITEINARLDGIDNYNMLINDIGLESFNKRYSHNNIALIFGVISQIDKSWVKDGHKRDQISEKLKSCNYLSNEPISLQQYMQDIASLPETMVGTVSLELTKFRGDMYADAFMELIDRYDYISPTERVVLDDNAIIKEILDSRKLKSDAKISTAALYFHFDEKNAQYLINANDHYIALEKKQKHSDISCREQIDVRNNDYQEPLNPFYKQKQLIVYSASRQGIATCMLDILKKYKNIIASDKLPDPEKINLYDYREKKHYYSDYHVIFVVDHHHETFDVKMNKNWDYDNLGIHFVSTGTKTALHYTNLSISQINDTLLLSKELVKYSLPMPNYVDFGVLKRVDPPGTEMIFKELDLSINDTSSWPVLLLAQGIGFIDIIKLNGMTSKYIDITRNTNLIDDARYMIAFMKYLETQNAIVGSKMLEMSNATKIFIGR